MLTKEQKFAAIAVNIAAADGNTEKEEIQRIVALANVNGLDAKAVLEACVQECETRSDLEEVVAQMTEDDKELAIFAAIRIAMADGKVSVKEIQRVHTFCNAFGWGPQYVTIEYMKLLKKDPSALVQGVDF